MIRKIGYSFNIFGYLIKYLGYRGGPFPPNYEPSEKIKESPITVMIDGWGQLLKHAGQSLLSDRPDSLPQHPAPPLPILCETAAEMNNFLNFESRAIPDAITTPGRNKTVWDLGQCKITLEQHPYHPNAPIWHKDLHRYLDTPVNPHQRWLPGDPIPGY